MRVSEQRGGVLNVVALLAILLGSLGNTTAASAAVSPALQPLAAAPRTAHSPVHAAGRRAAPRGRGLAIGPAHPGGAFRLAPAFGATARRTVFVAPPSRPIALRLLRPTSRAGASRVRRRWRTAQVARAAAGATVTVNTDVWGQASGDTRSVSALLANPGSCRDRLAVAAPVPCISLTDALLAISVTGPGNTVVFHFDPRITYHNKVIGLAQPLGITQPNTTVNGDDGSGNPGVTITSTSKDTTTLQITSDGNTLTHLAIANVTISGTAAFGNHIVGNAIGVDPTGKPLPLSGNGIEVGGGAHDNVIGGPRTASTCVDPCNVISGNGGAAILISGTATMNNVVQGNNIGVDVTGVISIANVAGVQIVNAPGTTVGGDKGTSTECAGPCNIIGGSLDDGVLVMGASSTGTRIAGNYIGIAASGAISVPNWLNGIELGDGATATTIGGARASAGTCDGSCNVISGNTQTGILISDTTSLNTQITGNNIGVDGAGATALPNASSGILITGGGRPDDHRRRPRGRCV